jgi:hypothetical protein
MKLDDRFSGCNPRPPTSAFGPIGDPRLKRLEPGISHIDVSLRILTWPHIPRKFTRYSHLSSAFAPNRLFSSLGSAARVGSIPIARSILRQRQATQGYKIGVKTLIRWDSLGNRRRRGAAVSWPHVSPHCPEIHTYSHTQQFTEINCVIPRCPRSESDRRWLDLAVLRQTLVRRP